MYRFSSKVLISIIVCLSLTINVFASEVTVNEITVDGIVEPKEWGSSSIMLIQSGENVSFEFAQIFIIKDIDKSEICIGVKVTEKRPLNNLIKSSGVKIVFDEDYTLTLWANGDIFESNYEFVKEKEASIKTSNSYLIETRISYPKLCKNMKLKAVLIDVESNESPEFNINLDKMLLIQETVTVPNEQEKPQTNTTKSTTKNTTTTTRHTTENRTTSKAEVDSLKNITSGKSSKAQVQTTYKAYNEDVVRPQAVPLKNNVLTENLETQQENTNKRKIAGTTVAATLLVTAAALPVMKNIKDKKSDTQNLNKDE